MQIAILISTGQRVGILPRESEKPGYRTVVIPLASPVVRHRVFGIPEVDRRGQQLGHFQAPLQLHGAIQVVREDHLRIQDSSFEFKKLLKPIQGEADGPDTHPSST